MLTEMYLIIFIFVHNAYLATFCKGDSECELVV